MHVDRRPAVVPLDLPSVGADKTSWDRYDYATASSEGFAVPSGAARFTAVSDGGFAGGFVERDGRRLPMVAKGRSYAVLDDPAILSGEFFDVGDRIAVGRITDDSGAHAVVFDSVTQTIRRMSSGNTAVGVNATRWVAINSTAGPLLEAPDGSVRMLDTREFRGVELVDISDNNWILATADAPSGRQIIRWDTKGRLYPIAAPPNYRDVTPVRINANGDFVGFGTDPRGRVRPIAWWAGKPFVLGVDGGMALGINDAGQIVGADMDARNQVVGGVVWAPTRQRIDRATRAPSVGARVTLTGISNDGHMSGFATNRTTASILRRTMRPSVGSLLGTLLSAH
jgi:hypothetical protein